jgi:Fic family protein
MDPRSNSSAVEMKFHPKFEITPSIASSLGKIERTLGFLDAAHLSEDWVLKMQERALILEAHSTTHIEGTQQTLEQSERILAGQKVPEADPDDKRELLNYKKAFDFVSDYISSGGQITEGLIREIHKLLVEGVRGNSALPGQYRNQQNYVVNSKTKEVIYTPPPAYEVPHLDVKAIESIPMPALRSDLDHDYSGAKQS